MLITGTRATAVVTYTQAAYTQRDAKGTESSHPAQAAVSKLVTLDLVQDRWLVAGIEAYPAG